MSEKSMRDTRPGGLDPEGEGGIEAAGAQLSTAPVEDLGEAGLGTFGGRRAPGLAGGATWLVREAVGWVRWMWRQLTSMRVALILLFLLSLAAIPGSLIPQDSANAVKAQAWKGAHSTVAPVYEKLGLFHVYSSVWFSAVYILLFISLAGCIIPRSWQFVGQLRAKPPAAPRHLTRLPAYTTWRTEARPEQVLDAADKLLRGRRFRTDTAGSAVGSEKGFLREAGNLLFHVALFGLLISFAVGSLWHGEGGKLIVEGDGFSNNLTQYDDFTPGTFYGADDLNPFGFNLDGFNASYARTGPEKGTPRLFQANIHYWTGPDGGKTESTVAVNHPLEVAGSTVYLIGHGYAPVVTVRDARGEIAYRGAVPFLPQDGNLKSVGVIKVPDAKGADGKTDQLGFSGLFTPTFALDQVQGPHSTFPALDYPALILTAYHGDLGMDSGVPQSVYQLETRKLKQFKEKDGEIVKKALRPGDVMTLPDGAGSLSFDGIKTWASFQVSHQVGNEWALGSAVAMILGLAGSLFIQRRRVWVRAVRGEDGVTVVEMAGLGRSESAKIADELGELAHRLQPAAPALPEPGPSEPGPSEPGPSDSGPSNSSNLSEDSLPDEGARA